MIKGWCPEEDIYNAETTTRKVTMTYSSINFTIYSIVTHRSEEFSNDRNNKWYPSLHSNKFNVLKYRLTEDGLHHERYRIPLERT